MTVLMDRLQSALGDRYRIVRELGRGGMATVYQADDLRHRRQVAVKLLAPELANVIGTERFGREVEIAARLVHPNIVPMFESGEADGLLFYVMPLITGESLRSRLAREGALSIGDALEIARDVGTALNFAHLHGFVHRDVKPENILLQAGRAYVTDFGIALALRGVEQERLTSTGLTLGTPAYMSPEQATGDPRVDERTDIYSLGCVVYEMLSGAPPFEGSVRAVVARIVTERPVRLTAMRPTVPEAMSEVVDRAMAKMPADRYRTAQEFVDALHRGRSAPPRRVRVPRRRVGAAAAVMAGALVAAGIALVPRGGSTPAGARVERQLTRTGDAWSVALSPDGRKAAYLTDQSRALVVQDLETGDSTVAVRDSAGLNGAHGLKWKPDGSRILYNGPHPVGYAWYSVPVAGGKPEVVALTNGEIDFGPDDTTWISTLAAAIYIGSAPTTFQITADDSVVGDGTLIDLNRDYSFLLDARFAPDGRRIAAVATRRSGETQLISVDPDGRHTVLVPRLGWPSSPVDGWYRPVGVTWSADGRTLFFPRPQGAGWSVWSLSVDPRSGAAVGSPRVFVERLPAMLSFDVAGDGGRMVYSGGRTDIQLVRVGLDPAGRVTSTLTLTAGVAMHSGPGLSPDGSRVAYVRTDQDGRADVFLVSIEGGQERRLTSTGLPKGAVAWSPDGRRVAYVEQQEQHAALVVVDATTGEPTHRGSGQGMVSGNLLPPTWSPDGRHVLYQTAGARNYLVLDLRTGAERRLVENESVGWMFRPVFPPGGDGRSVAVAWHRPPTQYFWLVSLTDGSHRRIPGPVAHGVPLVWGADSAIYYEGGGTEHVEEIHRLDPATGRSALFARLPVRCLPSDITMSADARTLVCPTVSMSSDVWVSEPGATP